jgi:hypothetical protein
MILTQPANHQVGQMQVVVGPTIDATGPLRVEEEQTPVEASELELVEARDPIQETMETKVPICWTARQRCLLTRLQVTNERFHRSMMRAEPVPS